MIRRGDRARTRSGVVVRALEDEDDEGMVLVDHPHGQRRVAARGLRLPKEIAPRADKRVPPDALVALRLRDGGMGRAEICERLGVGLKTLESYLSRARQVGRLYE
jgi:DNA-directed RNA polymerase specialized sigma24 family protein